MRPLRPVLFLLVLTYATAAAAQHPLHRQGLGGQAMDGALPFEQVDPLSGNLVVTATDLVLPGNAGFDLRVQRVYNSAIYPGYATGDLTIEEDSWAGIGWRLHFGRVLHPDDTGSGETEIEMGDGSRQPLYTTAAFPEGWITRSFWLYDRTAHTLKMPNGVVYTFGHLVHVNDSLGDARYVTEIRDVFGNRLEFTYFDASGPVDGIARIRQVLSASQEREVTFTYNPTTKALATMQYAGRTWTYEQEAAGPPGFSRLTVVRPPVGIPSSYEYSNGTPAHELTVIHAPLGGTVTYLYGDKTHRTGAVSTTTRVVTTRTAAGRYVDPVTWTYTYDAGANQDQTTVSTPCTTTRYRFLGHGLSGDFSPLTAGALAERTVESAGTTYERETFSYVASEAISPDYVPGSEGIASSNGVFNALLASRTITRDTQTWTTTHTYRTGLGTFNDYGQPWQTEESSSFYHVRYTTRTYDHAFTPYIRGRLVNVWSRVRNDYSEWTWPIENTWSYDHATGTLTGQNLLGITSTFEWKPDGNLGASIDALGRRTSYEYSWGQVREARSAQVTTTAVINPDGTTAWSGISDRGVAYTYDAAFRLRDSTPTNGLTTTIDYDDFWGQKITTHRGTLTSVTWLGGFGGAYQTDGPDGVKVRQVGDVCGRGITFQSAPYTAGAGTRGVTTAFDPIGRPLQVTDAAGGITTYSYNGVDVTVTDPEHRTTTYDYDSFSGPVGERLLSVTDADGKTTSYQYDGLDHLVRVAVPGVPARTWRYDGNRLTSDTQPESGTTSYTYFANGLLQSVTNAMAEVTQFEYDDTGRSFRIVTPGSPDNVTITYNAYGQLETRTNATSSTTLHYDTVGRVKSRTDVIEGQTFVSTYAYNADDSLQQLTYPHGRVITYEYDGVARLAAVKNNGALFAHAFSYGDSGALASYQTGTVTHTFTLDERDRVKRLTALSPSSQGLDLTYTYDAADQVRAIGDPRPGASQSFAYDPVGRLATASGGWGQLAWTYDAAGNRLTELAETTTTYGYDSAHQWLTSISGPVPETFDYNPLGRLTNDSRGTYGYNAAGQLKQVLATGLTASYSYDGAGGRTVRTVNGVKTYTIRAADGTPLSEYTSPCGTPVWSSDVVYAAGRPLGAVKAVVASPTVNVASAAVTVGESSTTASVSFSITTPDGAPLTCPVTVSYHTTNMLAMAGADYAERSETVVFPSAAASGSTQTAIVSLVGDALDEGDETFAVDLSSATGASVGSANRTIVTITDDDPLPTLSVAGGSVLEGNAGTTSLTFTVSLNVPSGRAVTVNYATTDGTARAGLDYVGTAGTATIPAGAPNTVITVPVSGDLVHEAAEQFALDLSAPGNATLSTSHATGTITDDDPVLVSLAVDRTSAVQAGTPMTWTASASGASAPYEYQFWMSGGGMGWKIVQAYSTASAFSWTPSTAGTYYVEVRARSAGSDMPYDAVADSAAMTVTAAAPITIVSLTANTAMPVAAGSWVTWTAVASGGATPLQYKFYALDPVTGWALLADYGSSNTVVWNPLHPGTHALQVWVRRPGSTASYDVVGETGSLTVTAAAPVITALTANAQTPVAPGTPVMWTATAGGPSAALEYQFWLYRASTGTFTLGRAYSAASTWTWTPTTADTYLVQAWARVPGSGNAYDTWISSDYVTVASGAVAGVSLSVNQVLPVAPGTPLTWTAAATGGTAPLEFKFYRYDATADTWMLVQDWSASRTYTWTPTAATAGVGALQVWVRSSGSGLLWEAYAGTGLFVIVP